MKYDKLVRDNIPKIITDSGKKCSYKIVEGEELKSYLSKKLLEEVFEFLIAKTDNEHMEELIDIYEVMDSIKKVYNFNTLKMHNMKNLKAAKNGSFNKGIILLEVEE